MTLKYKFEDMPVTLSYDGGHAYRDIDFEYDTSINESDIIDYFTPRNTNEEYSKGVQYGMETIMNYINLDDMEEELEKDENFVEFMKERYYDQAYESCLEQNNC